MDTQSPIGHIAIVRAPDLASTNAAVVLVNDLLPLLESLTASGDILSWFIGDAAAAAQFAKSAGLLSNEDSKFVIFVSFQSREMLNTYYAHKTHRKLRETYYRQLPLLHSLWKKFDRVEGTDRKVLAKKIEEAVTTYYIFRVDFSVIAADNVNGVR